MLAAHRRYWLPGIAGVAFLWLLGPSPARAQVDMRQVDMRQVDMRQVDLAMPDLRQVDLSAPPDLTTTPDLTAPRDLAPAPDLLRAPDLAAPVPTEPVKFQGGGLSCSTTRRGAGDGGGLPAGGLAVLFGVVGCLSLRRRRAARRGGPPAGAGAALCLTALAALGAAPAHAQAVDAINFRPTGMPGGVLNVEGSLPPPHLGLAAGTVFSYASAPLLLVNANTGMMGTGEGAGVQGQALMNVGAALGIGGFLGFGFDVPVVLWQDLGDREAQRQLRAGAAMPAATPGGLFNQGTGSTGDLLRDPLTAGVGDLRLSLKVRVVDNTRKGFGLSIMPLVTAPTGDGNSYLGWGVATVEGRLIFDYRFERGLLIAANVSFFSHEQTRFLNLRLGHEMRYGAGLYWPLTERLALLAEIFGRIGLVNEAGEIGVTAENSPAEGLVGVRYRIPEGVTLQAGAGLGLGRGYGAPSSRVFASVGYTPAMGAAREQKAEPAPVVPEKVEQVPVVPVTPPPGKVEQAPAMRDRDRDRVEDDLDRCPDQAGPTENMGCPERDDDGDGLIDRLDQCPTVPGPREAMGCPLGGAPTQAPGGGQAPVKTLPVTADGGDLVALRGWRLEFAEPLSFAMGKAELSGRAEAQLQAAAKILQGRPDLSRLLIEGHVDEPNNTAERAKQLSRERAEVVRRKLVELGVAPERLQVEGFGYSRLLDRSETPEARLRNNRIEIIVLDTPPAAR